MLNLILTLVFSIVMLLFMAFPAMKIVEGLEKFIPLSDKWRNIAIIIVTIVLSLFIGLFLRFA